MSVIEGGDVRELPTVKWRDRMQDCIKERGEVFLRNLEQARGKCLDRYRWKPFSCGHPLGEPLSGVGVKND